MSNMRQLIVEIVRFVDENFPGWVASEFVDANGVRHTIIDKVPTFTASILDENSRYPQSGDMSCEVLAEWQDSAGRRLVRIATPGMESTEGLSEFVVLSAQLSAGSPAIHPPR
jgi:hypothetical protein